ncbi:MAG: SGNH/GDSL hydrolase family protein [Clostridiales bacterium]|nr:SGNH/GDSL hydrolase family protein [Clostridiales bacterium]
MKMIKKLITMVLSSALILSMFPGIVIADGKPASHPEYRQGRKLVALGDSFSSGESLGGYGSGLDPAALGHRSPLGWPCQLNLPGVDGNMLYNEGTNFYFEANSGATTENVRQTGKTVIDDKTGRRVGEQTKHVNRNGFEGDINLQGQLDVFYNGTVDPEEVDYVTMSIGGNDVDFSGIMKAAATGMVGCSGSTCDAINDKLTHLDDPGGTIDNLRKTYSRIAKAAPNATIIIVGYPPLLDPDCQENSDFFNEYEANAINRGVHKFNERIKELVKECKSNGMKIKFVDIEAEFEDHGAYSSDPWINGLVPTATDEELDQDEWISMDSIHPNQDGANAIARLVQQTIDEVEEEKAEMREKLGLDDDGTPVEEDVLESEEESDVSDISENEPEKPAGSDTESTIIGSDDNVIYYDSDILPTWLNGVWAPNRVSDYNAIQFEVINDHIIRETDVVVSRAEDGNVILEVRDSYDREYFVEAGTKTVYILRYYLGRPSYFDPDEEAYLLSWKIPYPADDPTVIDYVTSPRELEGTAENEFHDTKYRRDPK